MSNRRAGILVTLPLMCTVLFAVGPVHAVTVVPTQWIAQQFTEVLGRAPTPSEWSSWNSYYATNGCTTAALETKSKELLTGATFTANYPVDGVAEPSSLQKASRVLALVRAVYHREPNAADWSTYYSPYNSGAKTWEQTIDAVFGSGGYKSSVCSASNPNYGFDPDTLALDVNPLSSGSASRSQATIQALLDSQKPAACTSSTPIVTVTLNPREVIRIGGQGAYGTQLHIWPCERLTTGGISAGTGQYAKMARLVPNGPNAQILQRLLVLPLRRRASRSGREAGSRLGRW